MTASGVRAIRYASECSNVESVTASDVDATSIDYANHMIQLNHLTERITVIQANAIALLQHHIDARFDLVDLDPFGSPSPFFESALRCTAEDGILAATATDMAPLTGTRPAACFRKYGIVVARTEFEREIAVRVLAGCLSLASGRLQLAVKVVFTHASDHYARVYVQVNKGRSVANSSVQNLGFLQYCSHCLQRTTRGVFEECECNCKNCGSKMKVIGPLWLGKLWDPELVARMNQNAATIASSRLSDLQILLDRIAGEVDAPPFYRRVDKTAHSLRTNPPRVKEIVSVLRSLGYAATRTHFHSNAFRTNASDRIVRCAFARVNET
jgi:tRNA (guanine26-N2/guanine27-N2)-dimethyltransferase